MRFDLALLPAIQRISRRNFNPPGGKTSLFPACRRGRSIENSLNWQYRHTIQSRFRLAGSHNLAQVNHFKVNKVL